MKEERKPKYYVLMDNLRKDIERGIIQPGDKIESENQLAEKYKMSRHTVRKALSILESEGYIVAEHGRGTFCKERDMSIKSTKNVAVVTTYISDYIFPRLIQGMYQTLDEEGYSVIIKNTGNSPKLEGKILQELIDKNIDGLIIEPSKSEIYSENVELYKKLDEYRIPYVFIHATYPQLEDKPHIVMDDIGGAKILTQHLIDLGHKRIAGVFKADDNQGAERHRGYIEGLTSNGMTYDPNIVALFHTEDKDYKPVAEVLKWVKSGEKIDGIVCYNDQIAYEIAAALRNEGIRIPEDVSLTGFDNLAMPWMNDLRITTIAHPREHFGEKAARLLIEKINHVSDADSKIARVVESKLIVGNSCADRRG
ncbi:MAG: GntR family transcriptional regulator [Lachnospiraceae bacterium]|nr:GntR family transcriptional regulator [Lachnospiraceae bacterium]